MGLNLTYFYLLIFRIFLKPANSLHPILHPPAPPLPHPLPRPSRRLASIKLHLYETQLLRFLFHIQGYSQVRETF